MPAIFFTIESVTTGISVALMPGYRVPVEGMLASPLMVETTAVFLPAEPNFLMSATSSASRNGERRVADHDVFFFDAFGPQISFQDLVGGAR